MKKIRLVAMLFVLICHGSVNADTLVEDALVNDPLYDISGIFGQHDFVDAVDAFDWAFTTNSGTSYQLQGNSPSDSDVFGWKKVTIDTPTPAWYMFQLHDDIDADGSKKFDWILASTNMQKKAMYKLEGVSQSGNFLYSSKLGIDYKINGNVIATGLAGSFITASGLSSIFPSIIGKTLYLNRCGNIVVYTFGSNGKLHIQEDGDSFFIDYSIEDDTIETIGDQIGLHTILEVTSEYLKAFESDGTLTMLYFDENAAASAQNGNCDDESDDAVIHHINITPYPLATAADGATINFTATAVDKNGNAVTPQPALIWSSDNSVATIATIDSQHAIVTLHSNASGTCATISVIGEDGQYEASSHAALLGTTDEYPCPPE